MPWAIKKIGKKYCVVKKTTGERKKCYSSRKAALPYLKALYANTKDESVNESNTTFQDFVKENRYWSQHPEEAEEIGSSGRDFHDAWIRRHEPFDASEYTQPEAAPIKFGPTYVKVIAAGRGDPNRIGELGKVVGGAGEKSPNVQKVMFLDGETGFYNSEDLKAIHRNDLPHMRLEPMHEGFDDSGTAGFGTGFEGNIDEEEHFQEGDPVRVKGPVKYEGITGYIKEVSPSGSFYWVQLRNGETVAYHGSDLTAYDPDVGEPRDVEDDYGFEKWNDAETRRAPWEYEDDPRNPYNDSVETPIKESMDFNTWINIVKELFSENVPSHGLKGLVQAGLIEKQEIEDAYNFGFDPKQTLQYLVTKLKGFESVKLESTGADCNIIERQPGKWYLSIQQWPYGENPNYDEKGPFSSDKAALAYLNKKYANPGGYGVIPYREDFKTVAESVIDQVNNVQPGFWYTFGEKGPIFEYRANKRNKVIALPPQQLAGKLLEQREVDGKWFIRMENQVPQEWLHKYGLVVVEAHDDQIGTQCPHCGHPWNGRSMIRDKNAKGEIATFPMCQDCKKRVSNTALHWEQLEDPLHPGESQLQRGTVHALTRAGFRVTKASEQFGEYTVYMSRRYRGGMHLAQVEEDGLVNGEPIGKFLAGFRRR